MRGNYIQMQKKKRKIHLCSSNYVPLKSLYFLKIIYIEKERILLLYKWILLPTFTMLFIVEPKLL